MMNRSTYLLCILITTAVFVGLTTPVLAGPTPTPASPTPATPTPATATPIPEPNQCVIDNPVSFIVTVAKGKSPAVNALITHTILGNIVDPGSLSSTAHNIRVCAGTNVNAAVFDLGGGGLTNTAKGSLSCNADGCFGVVNVKEKYTSTSSGSSDKDTIIFHPQPDELLD